MTIKPLLVCFGVVLNKNRSKAILYQMLCYQIPSPQTNSFVANGLHTVPNILVSYAAIGDIHCKL